jgi:isoleucyl-tRNA synthetase
MSDANWGPQDASLSGSSQDLPYFVSRSMSAFYIDILSPVHWMSKRQKVTAASSAEAEIYATDECCKFLSDLAQILDFLDVKQTFMPSTTIIYNDNKACVQWSKKVNTKGLRHIQMCENRVRENIASKFISVCHIEGKINLADIFTKEMKDTSHFVELRDLFMCPRFKI